MIKTEYAIYKGDNLICIGTKEHLCKTLNLKLGTVSYLCSQAAYKRYLKSGLKNSMFGIKIDMKELLKELNEENERLGIS